MLVREGAAIPHIGLAQSTTLMDWSKLELVAYGDAAKATGLVALPADGALHEVTAAGQGDALRLSNDPLKGKVAWTIRRAAPQPEK
jgi:alpha-D-xyloside xylohydrolase